MYLFLIRHQVVNTMLNSCCILLMAKAFDETFCFRYNNEASIAPGKVHVRCSQREFNTWCQGQGSLVGAFVDEGLISGRRLATFFSLALLHVPFCSPEWSSTGVPNLPLLPSGSGRPRSPLSKLTSLDEIMSLSNSHGLKMLIGSSFAWLLCLFLLAHWQWNTLFVFSTAASNQWGR